MNHEHGRLDYAAIKKLAKQTGKRITDLIALAPQNDPFYVGTPADIQNAEWFLRVWRDWEKHRKSAGDSGDAYLRGFHYWTQAQSPAIPMPNGMPYENTNPCWAFLCQASKKARYLELIGLHEVIDHKHPQPHIHADYDGYFGSASYNIDIPDLNDPEVFIYGLRNSIVQPYHLEVWCEKSSMDGLLIPVCKTYNANFVPLTGESSIPACTGLIQRIAASGNKPARIWYVSDHDPGGTSMPVAMSRKAEFFLQNEGLDVRVKPLAVTPQQVEQYQLPRVPIKETERRAGKFEEAFGQGAVELDALQALYPGVLTDLARDELEVYYSQEAKDAVDEQQEDLRLAINEQVEAITSKYQRQIKALQKMRKELAEIEIDTSQYNVDPYEPDVEENEDDWLFDSQRDYLSQIAKYKLHKKGNGNC